MRHRKTVIKLGRTAAHRNAVLSNLAASLFEKKHIQTTEIKAKAVRGYSERLITLAKRKSLHARRIAFRFLHRKQAVHVLFDEIAPRFTDRNGGYTRVVKLGQRPGDGAPMAVIELVGFDTASKKHKERETKKEEAKKKAAKAEKAEKSEKAETGTKSKKEEKKPKTDAKGKAQEKGKGKEPSKGKTEEDKGKDKKKK